MRRIYTIWKNLAEIIGNFQATIIFSLLYFLLVTPLGTIANFFKDYLGLKSKISWRKMEDNTTTIEKLKLQ